MTLAEKTRPPLIFQSRVRATPATVFDAFFKDPARWLCRSAEIDPRVDGRLRLCWPEGCFEGQFVQFEPASVARFSWRMPGESLPETMVVVRTDFNPSDAQVTHLEIEHYGFGVGADWDLLYVGMARAWASYLKNLRAVLESGLDLREDHE